MVEVCGRLEPVGRCLPGGLRVTDESLSRPVWREGWEGAAWMGPAEPCRLLLLAVKSHAASPTVKPDPPANIIVTAVVGNAQWLNVTWKDPHSWNSDFYRLRFELRYRAERSETFTTWTVSSSLLNR